MEGKKINKGKVILHLTLYLGIAAMGMVLGMMLQQAITQSTLMKVADNLDGVQIDIDLNETQLINGMADFYTPYFEEELSRSEEEIYFNKEDSEWYKTIGNTTFIWDLEENVWRRN